MMRRFSVAVALLTALAGVWLAGCAREDLAGHSEVAPPPDEVQQFAEAPPAEADESASTEDMSATVIPDEAQPAAAAPAAAAPAAAQPPVSAPPPAATAPAPATASAPAPRPAEPTGPAPAPAVSAADRGTVVIGRVSIVSNVPEPSSVPYADCLTMIKYTVESVESGSYTGGELLAAYWGMRDAQLQPPAKFRVGQRHRLVIEPLADHPDLSRAMQADDTNEYTLSPQWVLEYSAP
ncbi:MAG: hypothetical protein ACOX9R_03370 [Armatimonadota bacterium]|jgi:hypothetical protein